MMSDHARKTPVFWGHGTQDAVVAFKWGEMSVEILKQTLKFQNVQFEKYRMGHSSDPKEIRDLEAWLQSILPKNESG